MTIGLQTAKNSLISLLTCAKQSLAMRSFSSVSHGTRALSPWSSSASSSVRQAFRCAVAPARQSRSFRYLHTVFSNQQLLLDSLFCFNYDQKGICSQRPCAVGYSHVCKPSVVGSAAFLQDHGSCCFASWNCGPSKRGQGEDAIGMFERLASLETAARQRHGSSSIEPCWLRFWAARLYASGLVHKHPGNTTG